MREREGARWGGGETLSMASSSAAIHCRSPSSAPSVAFPQPPRIASSDCPSTVPAAAAHAADTGPACAARPSRPWRRPAPAATARAERSCGRAATAAADPRVSQR